MKLDYQMVNRNLKKGEIAPLYLFVGAEDYLIEEIINLIKGKLVVKGEEELNFDMLYGSDSSAQTILEKVETASFFGNRRLVVVQDAGSLKDKEKKLLISYCENPFVENCLVLVDDKIDSKDKLQSAVLSSKDAIISYFWPLFPNQVPSWIQNYTRAKGKTISHEAAQILQEMAGGALRNLVFEIEKLITYTGERKNIEEEDVWEAVSSGNIENIFKLTDALGEKRLDRALTIFNQLVQRGEDLIAMLGLLTRHFRILWKIKEMEEEGNSPLEISQAVKIKPLFLKNYFQQTKDFSWSNLKDIFKRILQADYEIKRGIAKPETALESLLISFAE